MTQRKFWVLVPKEKEEEMGLSGPHTRSLHLNMSQERESDERLVELDLKQVTSGRDCPSVDYHCQEVLVPLLLKVNSQVYPTPCLSPMREPALAYSSVFVWTIDLSPYSHRNIFAATSFQDHKLPQKLKSRCMPNLIGVSDFF